MSNGALFHGCRLIHDHRSGTAVDDNFGLAGRRADIETLHFRQESDSLVAAAGGTYLDCPPIQRGSGALPKLAVDRFHYPARSRKISGMQIKPDEVPLAKGDGYCSLDRCAACNTARAQMIDLNLASARRGSKSSYQQVTLRHRIDLPVGAP